MEILLNGRPESLTGPLSAAQLLEQLALTGHRIAIEINGEILPRSGYPERQIENGDRVEIIHAVGGG